MSEESRVLGEGQRASVWRSSLTEALFRWSDSQGWQVYAKLGSVPQWRPCRPGIATETVYARSGEVFTEEPPS